jgi:rubrerythrin
MDYDPMNPEFCPICGAEMVPYTVGMWIENDKYVHYFLFNETEEVPEDAEPVECLRCTMCTYISVDGNEGAIERLKPRQRK